MLGGQWVLLIYEVTAVVRCRRASQAARQQGPLQDARVIAERSLEADLEAGAWGSCEATCDRVIDVCWT